MTVAPLTIGPLTFSVPIIQAPLSGYSDAPMRRLARRFGASFALCEVFLDQFVMNVSKRSKARLYLAVRDTDHPCGAQLMGSDPDEFVRAALRLCEFGFDLIDLNFACPVPKVVGRCRGGHLMAHPEHALAIAKKVRDALPANIPLTVKLRKGFDESPVSRMHFFELLHGLLDCGVSAITLHGRTVRQRYEGQADWSFVAEVKQYLIEDECRPDFPLIGSGDLLSAEICRRRMEESGVNGLALARGIIGNPWLFREVNAILTGEPLPSPPSLDEQREVLLWHFDEVAALYGENRAATVMRKFAVRYAQRHPQYEELRQAFVVVKNRAGWEKILSDFYGK
ncbi:MAG: tRNA-dihydrouridine synthase [Planctomycetia bacterium]|nr:tRNA-dihydrouridine synthase [Planctomycetia bacterium]